MNWPVKVVRGGVLWGIVVWGAKNFPGVSCPVMVSLMEHFLSHCFCIVCRMVARLLESTGQVTVGQPTTPYTGLDVVRSLCRMV